MVGRKNVKGRYLLDKEEVKRKVLEQFHSSRHSRTQELFNKLRLQDSSQVKNTLRKAVQDVSEQQSQQIHDKYRTGGRENFEIEQYSLEQIDTLLQEEQELIVDEFMRAIYEENYEQLEAYEQGEVQQQAELMQQEVEAREAGEVLLPCPVCKQAFLQENSGVVSCPVDEFHIRTTIIKIKQKLEGVLQSHFSSGCTETNVYFLPEQRFASANLVVYCETCGFKSDVL
eukprot:TRINITY_DN3539_c1_g2_i1.p3 TRINITY_DN3539_c1_g2~~TRINITY_DN3539_c1_g2_i1.p3  ORF type:complete len:228 (-),score=30.70 TRINITY_DN3539_c1_g2_i1:2110-2793(-)